MHQGQIRSLRSLGFVRIRLQLLLPLGVSMIAGGRPRRKFCIVSGVSVYQRLHLAFRTRPKIRGRRE